MAAVLVFTGLDEALQAVGVLGDPGLGRVFRRAFGVERPDFISEPGRQTLELVLDHLFFRPGPVDIGLPHPVLVIDPAFTGVMKERDRRRFLRIRAFQFCQHIGDGCGAEAVLSDALGLVDSGDPPS